MRTYVKSVVVLFSPLLVHVSGFSCPNYCSYHGICHSEGICTCDDGWTGPACADATCSERMDNTHGIAWADVVTDIDVAHGTRTLPCSNRGTCELTSGLCTCDVGFTGALCERSSCDCHGHGRCETLGLYATRKDPGSGPVYTYDTNWDAHKIQGCVCDSPYSGVNCLERVCPTGDDPMTGTTEDPAGIQLNEKQVIHCKATSGSFTITFRGHTTAPIFTDDTTTILTEKLLALPSLNGILVTFSGITAEACNTIGNDITLEFTQDFGNVPTCQIDETSLFHSSVTVELTVSTLVSGTKENIPCSGRGVCNTLTGLCECSLGFFSSDGEGGIGKRRDCGHPLVTISSCPGDISCSGHGVCQGPPRYDCVCNDGWTGGDCSEKICPIGHAWFDVPVTVNNEAHEMVECSQAGVCDRITGICRCKSGYTGASCNRLDCQNACSGHGTCVTMSELAKTSDMNGDATDWTYGAVPNKKETWDYDMVQGCLCDSGYTGHACEKRLCPTGDDVMTITTSHSKNELQVLTCVGATGSFSLVFRQDMTDAISYSATASDVQAALESLSTIGTVSVVFTAGSSTACTSDGSNAMSIEFTSEFGDLPKLTAVLDGGVTSLTILADGESSSSSHRGTKENAPCSNRGVCDFDTGLCHCYTGFSSSDGNGHQGERGDCGFFEPIYFLSAAQAHNNQ